MLSSGTCVENRQKLAGQCPTPLERGAFEPADQLQNHGGKRVTRKTTNFSVAVRRYKSRLALLSIDVGAVEKDERIYSIIILVRKVFYSTVRRLTNQPDASGTTIAYDFPSVLVLDMRSVHIFLCVQTL